MGTSPEIVKSSASGPGPLGLMIVMVFCPSAKTGLMVVCA